MADPLGIVLATLACYIAFFTARFAATQKADWPLFGALTIVGAFTVAILVTSRLTGYPALLATTAFVASIWVGAAVGRRSQSTR